MQYHRDEPVVNKTGNIISFLLIILVLRLNLKKKKTDQTAIDGTKDVEIMVPLKYLIDVWITLEMPLIECEINLILKWSAICFISAGTAANHYIM